MKHAWKWVLVTVLINFGNLSADSTDLDIDSESFEYTGHSHHQPQNDPPCHNGTSSWKPLKHQPSFDIGANTPMLLTDGSVIVHSMGTPETWRLVPDIHGSYINGTWSQAASLPNGYIPLYHASAVLRDGRLIYEGGEYNGANFQAVWTGLGAIYDPVADTWTSVAPPSFFTGNVPSPNPIGDAQSVVLANGTFMVADALSRQAALLDPLTLTWTETGTSTKYDSNNEEGWTLLPDGKVLTINTYTDINPYPSNPTKSELYDPTTGTWSFAGSTHVTLTDTIGFEVGPAVLRPDGTVFAVGSNGNTAIYDSANSVWSVGPNLPMGSGTQGQLGSQDGPAALLPNGNVLVVAAPISPYFGSGLHVYEFNGLKFINKPNIPNAANISTFPCNMLVLPTGQILMTTQSNDVEIYTPGNRCYNTAWAPVITNAPANVNRGTFHKITGIRFNGMSQASGYGDDYQSATNYPLVRITNVNSGHVFYARTFNHSSMAVASNKKVSTHYLVPPNIELGKSKLEVVANGIPSKPFIIHISN